MSAQLLFIFVLVQLGLGLDIVRDDPPPWAEYAKMARHVVHVSDWAGMATIATRDPIVGYPFANVFSMADGPIGNSSGVPYMYTTPMEMSIIDLTANPQASLTMSLAQGNYCSDHDYDQEDPRCAHIILTGTVVTIDSNSEEASFAQEALFSRHPAMSTWPEDHGWFFAKLDITNILLLDWFGGATTVSIDEYFQVILD